MMRRRRKRNNRRRSSREEKCRNCEEKTACVPFFLHENTVMHFNRINKRVIIAFAALFVAMCVTVSIIISVLVSNNTIREKQIIDMMNQRITEVSNGVYKYPDP